MAYQPIEELLPKADFSVYRLVRMASKRALELSENAGKLIDAPANQKLATTALDEIRAAKVVLKSVAEEFAPEKTARLKKSK